MNYIAYANDIKKVMYALSKRKNVYLILLQLKQKSL